MERRISNLRHTADNPEWKRRAEQRKNNLGKEWPDNEETPPYLTAEDVNTLHRGIYLIVRSIYPMAHRMPYRARVTRIDVNNSGRVISCTVYISKKNGAPKNPPPGWNPTMTIEGGMMPRLCHLSTPENDEWAEKKRKAGVNG